MRRDAPTHRVLRASAGTGKTHQLTNHFIRLLASDVKVESILATTFTRKAAGEIQGRILERLAEAAGDDEKARELAKQIDAPVIRSQFALILTGLLKNLHRVRIATLDSFFQSLGRTFGFELGLPPGWEICDEADDERLRQEALERVLERENEAVLASLYQRLTFGHMKRAVQAELMRVVKNLHEVYQETPAEAWNRIVVPRALFPTELDNVLDGIEAFDLSSEDRRMHPARQDDIESARSEEWLELLKKGLIAGVFQGKNSYHGKAIPEDLIALYQKLIQHAGSMLVEQLAAQTVATREFLDAFDRELRALQLSSGSLRFGDVTQTLSRTMQSRVAAGLGYRLGGAVKHLLLDEFQDTSLSQWRVLEPLARAITQAPGGRTFFCVGDVKQAIYGWRGGLTRIFNSLGSWLGPLNEEQLATSQRSASPIINAVNKVFGRLDTLHVEKCEAAIASWQSRFELHDTVKGNEPGYVGLHTGPGQQDGEKLLALRARHCRYVAERIRDLTQQMRGWSIGVLCRKNDTLARLVFELRDLGVKVSEEGGNPLTDSAAVELMLSLCTLADHPGHRVASFHVWNSPLKEHLATLGDKDQLSHHLREEILRKGYGVFAQEWASRLVSACDARELSRLDQLVVVAYDYQRRSTLRTSDFVAWIRKQRMPDPSDADVRVMTIHGAKGLEFDVVVLPELDPCLTPRHPAFVVRRDPDKLDTNFVCRYTNETIQRLLSAEERVAFDDSRRQSMEESLSLLYVALTRAAHALHIYIPGPRKSEPEDAWCSLLRRTLAPDASFREKATLFETSHGVLTAKSSETPSLRRPATIKFRTESCGPRRGLEHVAPSRREGKSRVVLTRLFNRDERLRTGLGTLHHAWFATIDWLDEGAPTDSHLVAAAEKVRQLLPAQDWSRLDRLIGEFRTHCQAPAIAAVLHRAAYAAPDRDGFPSALGSCWRPGLSAQDVERERRFVVYDGTEFLNGSVDRVVWIHDGKRRVAADIIDFKTDAIPANDAAALAQRVEYYRPQMECYRRAVARLSGLPGERIAIRLAFSAVGRVVEL